MNLAMAVGSLIGVTAGGGWSISWYLCGLSVVLPDELRDLQGASLHCHPALLLPALPPCTAAALYTAAAACTSTAAAAALYTAAACMAHTTALMAVRCSQHLDKLCEFLSMCPCCWGEGLFHGFLNDYSPTPAPEDCIPHQNELRNVRSSQASQLPAQPPLIPFTLPPSPRDTTPLLSNLSSTSHYVSWNYSWSECWY